MKVSLSLLHWTGASTLVSSLSHQGHPPSKFLPHTFYDPNNNAIYLDNTQYIYKHYFLTFFIYFKHTIKQNFIHHITNVMPHYLYFNLDNLVVIHIKFRKMCIVPIVKLFENRFDTIDSCSLIQHAFVKWTATSEKIRKI